MLCFGRAARRGLLTLLLVAVSSVGAGAQDTGDGAPMAVKPVIGVLDLNQVMARGQAAQGLMSQRETYVERYQTEVAETEKELRDVDQDLMRQRATLEPDAFAERRRAFQERVNTFQTQVQSRRAKLEKAFSSAMNTIQSAVIRVTKDVAEKRGMNVILYRSQTFLFDPDLDITDAVLAAVDRQLPAVQMKDPETLPDSAGSEER